jgi:hypothetical protein
LKCVGDVGDVSSHARRRDVSSHARRRRRLVPCETHGTSRPMQSHAVTAWDAHGRYPTGSCGRYLPLLAGHTTGRGNVGRASGRRLGEAAEGQQRVRCRARVVPAQLQAQPHLQLLYFYIMLHTGTATRARPGPRHRARPRHRVRAVVRASAPGVVSRCCQHPARTTHVLPAFCPPSPCPHQAPPGPGPAPPHPLPVHHHHALATTACLNCAISVRVRARRCPDCYAQRRQAGSARCSAAEPGLCW